MAFLALCAALCLAAVAAAAGLLIQGIRHKRAAYLAVSASLFLLLGTGYCALLWFVISM